MSCSFQIAGGPSTSSPRSTVNNPSSSKKDVGEPMELAGTDSDDDTPMKMAEMEKLKAKSAKSVTNYGSGTDGKSFSFFVEDQ